MVLRRKVQLHAGKRNIILRACEMCEEACTIEGVFDLVVVVVVVNFAVAGRRR